MDGELWTEDVARRAVQAAVERLGEAAQALCDQETLPRTPLPHWRSYTLVRCRDGSRVVWIGDTTVRFEVRGETPVTCNLRSLITSGSWLRRLLELTDYQPRRVLRVVEQCDAAAAWCRARMAGRERQARRLLRSQERAAERVLAHATLATLAGHAP